jgi:hypothetical protein
VGQAAAGRPSPGVQMCYPEKGPNFSHQAQHLLRIGAKNFDPFTLSTGKT